METGKGSLRVYVLAGARRRRDATRRSEGERNGGALGGEERRGCCVSYGCGKVGIRVKHVSTCEVRINVFPNTCR